MLLMPSDLPWWEWLSISLWAWIVVGLAFDYNDKKDYRRLAIFVELTSGVVGAITGAMTAIVLVKIWYS